MINIKRRRLLGLIAATSTALALDGPTAALAGVKATQPKRAGASVMNLVKPKMNEVRLGIVGVGMRGSGLLRKLMSIEGVRVNGICDIYRPALDKAAKVALELTGSTPPLYTGRDDSYKEMVERTDIDVVFIATPWQWHVPIALAAIAAGKETFVEVPAATSLDDCWRLVEASERHQVNCMMLENCFYGETELMVCNMVRDGLLGSITHGEGAYIHDLRWLLKDRVVGEGSWRPEWYTKRKGNTYPTHGLGPIAHCMDINRGDRFDYLVSMSSPARSNAAYSKRTFPPDDPNNRMTYVQGDMNCSLIQTASGRTILIQHDVATPRPYSRLNLLQGDKGTFAGYPDRLALDEYKGGEEWITDLQWWDAKYGSVLWKTVTAAERGTTGHGGMDLVMLRRIVYCLRNGLPLDQNVYDAAAWSAVFDLSEQSVRSRSQPKDFPDFTRGAWKTTEALEIKV